MYRKLIKISRNMQNIGFTLVPLSFVFYFLLRCSELNKEISHKSKLAKAIWYFVVGIGSIHGDLRIDQLVVMMVFFDSFDSVIDYLVESKRSKKD